MRVLKITTGSVVQAFDTDTQQFVEQWFQAGDQVEYETESGQPTDSFDDYLSFDMRQPDDGN